MPMGAEGGINQRRGAIGTADSKRLALRRTNTFVYLINT